MPATSRELIHPYRNVWLGSVGTDYRITPAVSFGGSYDWQEAVTRTGSREAAVADTQWQRSLPAEDAVPGWHHACDL